MDLEAATAIQLDPALLMHEVGMVPDPWQARALRSEAKRLLILSARQLGKSTTISLIALHPAIFRPDSLVLLVSRTERQSILLFEKVRGAYRALGDPVPIVRELTFSLELANGSRIVALPGDPDNIRGFSAPFLVVIDEGAIVDDNLFAAVLPMVATSNGRIVVASTPSGRLGFFAAQCRSSDSIWETIVAKASECPRISAKFLEEQRKLLGERKYAQEFECMFIGDGGAVFRRVAEAIDRGRTETTLVTDPTLAFGIGVDIGRYNDATCITIVDSSGRQVFFDRFTDVSYPRQIQAIKAAYTVLAELADKTLGGPENLPGWRQSRWQQQRRLQEPSIILDATGAGAPLYEQLINEDIPVMPFTFTNTSKLRLLGELAAALDNAALRLMDIEIQEQELLGFEQERTPAGNIRMGTQSGHDDTVIALALAYYGASGGGFYSSD